MILMTILQLYDHFLSYTVNVKLLTLNSRFVTIVVTNLNLQFCLLVDRKWRGKRRGRV